MRRSSFDWTTAKRRRWRQQADRRRQSSFVRRLHTESLEDRCLLTVITVDTKCPLDTFPNFMIFLIKQLADGRFTVVNFFEKVIATPFF